MKYCILLFYISYTKIKKKIIYGPPKDKFLTPQLDQTSMHDKVVQVQTL